MDSCFDGKIVVADTTRVIALPALLCELCGSIDSPAKSIDLGIASTILVPNDFCISPRLMTELSNFDATDAPPISTDEYDLEKQIVCIK